MNINKLLPICAMISITSLVLAAGSDRTILSMLEGNKSKTYDLTIPKGKTSIVVEQAADTAKPVLSCIFSNSSGDIGLEEIKVARCEGKLVLSTENKIKLKVTNESNSTLDIKVRQIFVKNK